MYARFKCDNCKEWHGLDNFDAKQLKMFLVLALKYQFEPFSAQEWAKVIAAEMKRRGLLG